MLSKMKEIEISRRTKLLIAVVFLGVAIITLILPGPLGLMEREEAMCREKCSKAQKGWRLVPAHPPPMVSSGKFDGPWTCECY